MLRFTKPGNVDKSLFEAYKYLGRSLSRIIGYPVHFRLETESTPPAAEQVIHLPSGGLEYRLPDSRRARMHYYASIGPVAAGDKFCRSVLSGFVKACRRLAEQCKNSWDILTYVMKEEQFLWDILVLSQSHSGAQMFKAMDILAGLRESLLFRYEGKNLRQGVFVTWNWHNLKPRLANAGCAILSFKERADFREAFRRSKMLHVLADGRNTFIVVSPLGRICTLVATPRQQPGGNESEWEMVPSQFRYLESVLMGRDLAFTTTDGNEIYLFHRLHVLKWAQQSWHRVSGRPLREDLEKHLPVDVASIISQAAVEMSFHKIGGLIAVTARPDMLLVGGSKGLREQLSGLRSLKITSENIGLILRFASIDGGTVFDNAGRLVNAGVIFNVPQQHTSAGEGARTAAASFASTHGIAVKISDDGPISVFENEHLLRLIA